ncbi:MAG: UDP-N-acetylmuramoyl-L-alanyl-D-glutamate--2,6-diaminopimelate ligase [Rhodocyclaceae bacterium]|jgi:UDP-N-acetylmuramoyl-L-alanyl-D-glutamate--2,6-diaminopimelate ligase|nr:UDP-N-acetylmuramoyl-L-alanyl-D-glutamate--2,6-diaminopimelate ligase [Rhodocyclaceae bacterium]MCA3133826.1 UDP-N-acetylmuramoyl-L-alanyl-D-glutamate--2,6-diaminopimelate ligase [Rhodocyclaceae bacterium]MCA3142832.1 UDP-N-acetylmuramoyl-L-alanyl-D-glutamate--2,6-diaminopimelate ligase [Rhodocyclaceae bacterium]MCA3145550.1 UDP-N-acetylmuramoyl-L-alanyl-D-glutamate--2,6-diaminopimelate ligase [Rhodocyclaceae bacterium]
MHGAAASERALLESLGVPLRGMSADSRRISPGDVFVAFPGERSDGRAFIPQALAAGAAAVLFEPRGFHWNPDWPAPHAAVPGLRGRVAALAAETFGHPSRILRIAGVTGTNGKTSCSHWIAQSLGRLGTPCALMGTLGNGFPGALEPASLTTADAVSLQGSLRRLADGGARAVAMEVSSHGLDQGRVAGVHFHTALFTNLTRDHLDYHGDMAAYGAAKAKLFAWPGLANAVINLDDAFGRALLEGIDRTRTRVLGYGVGHGDIAAHGIDLSTRGLSLEIRTPWGAAQLRSRLLGGFNVSNLLGSLGVLLASDVTLEAAAGALCEVEPVAGRMQLVRVPGRPLVVVDYAHTPDALQKVLETLRELVGREAGARLLCVFGCGGERDPGKRPLMGEIATRLSDLAIVTSDNPRSEDPHAIIEQVAAGAHANHVAEPDRAAAIARAVREAGPRDVVLVAGKGHERTQEVAGRRLPFDDVHVARTVLETAHV